ncbi:MAG: bifunctional riboflavin kinase/FAD synthetase [Planctomycetota bacterium]
MKVYTDPEVAGDALRGAVLTVGNFDGVHLGHQRILRTARALARVSSAKTVALTFEPHPLAALRPEWAPARLTLWEEKRRQLQLAGADAVVRLAADATVLSLTAEDFVKRILVQDLHPSYLVEGPDFGFGRNRGGNIETLRAMSARGGFQVHVVEPYRLWLSGDRHVTVSSTVIRECLSQGEVEDATACLGRPYVLMGEVVHGAGDGHKLGFPTINLNVRGQLAPAEGVYAGWAEVNGVRGAAAISIGRRPTMDGQELTIEAFIIDQSGDWYAANARIGFVSRLRDQVRFVDRAALAAQIAQDVEAVRVVVQVSECHP